LPHHRQAIAHNGREVASQRQGRKKPIPKLKHFREHRHTYHHNTHYAEKRSLRVLGGCIHIPIFRITLTTHVVTMCITRAALTNFAFTLLACNRNTRTRTCIRLHAVSTISTVLARVSRFLSFLCHLCNLFLFRSVCLLANDF